MAAMANQLSSLIRRARLDAALTQNQLAGRAGTSQPAVARYESGRGVPTLATLERLLAACGRRAVVSAVALDGASDAGQAPSRLHGPGAELLRRSRQRLLAAAARRGARDVRVFGSVGRGEQHRRSDVDLLVELAPRRTLLDLAAFRREAAEILGVSVDVATPDMLREPIRAAVMAEARPL